MSRIIFTLVLAAVSSGCGNPVNLEKDLRREEGRRKDSEAANKELQDENRQLKEHLQGIFVSDSFLWFFGQLPANYEEAVKVCEDVKYKLPNNSQLREFDEQVFKKNPDWAGKSIGDSAFSIDNIHVTPKKDGASPEIALCMHERE